MAKREERGKMVLTIIFTVICIVPSFSETTASTIGVFVSGSFATLAVVLAIKACFPAFVPYT